MLTRNYFSEHAYLPSGWARDVKIVVSNGIIKCIETAASSANCTVLDGPTLPAVANLHSHAFQRIMAGMAEVSLKPDESFWSWRNLMYKLVGKLTPEQVRTIAIQLYIELLKAGYTQVAEFHYLHHDKTGQPYDQPTEMSEQLVDAAGLAGLGITLLPVLYSYSGFGAQEPTAAQARFINSCENYLKLHQSCATLIEKNHLNRLGVCFHSLRAVNQLQISEVLASTNSQQPIHIHIAEQQKEVSECIAWSGQRPVEWLNNVVELSPRWCLVHSTHITSDEIKSIAQSGAVVGLCPSTEANLGDGIFPAVNYINQRGICGIGTDSHVGLSIANELRTLEYGQRLRDQQRNRLYNATINNVGEFLFQQARTGGDQACDVSLSLQSGSRADFLVLDKNHPFIGASQPQDILNRWIFACEGNLIKHVYVAGVPIIENFRHPLEEESRAAFSQLIRNVMGH